MTLPMKVINRTNKSIDRIEIINFSYFRSRSSMLSDFRCVYHTAFILEDSNMSEELKHETGTINCCTSLPQKQIQLENSTQLYERCYSFIFTFLNLTYFLNVKLSNGDSRGSASILTLQNKHTEIY